MILRQVCRAKIHRLKVTDSRLDYEGSITIDGTLLAAADIMPMEKVQVVNITTGDRFETYVIKGKDRSGAVCLNGGAARLGNPGDIIIVIAYAGIDEEAIKKFRPNIILVDEKNRIKGIKHK